MVIVLKKQVTMTMGIQPAVLFLYYQEKKRNQRPSYSGHEAIYKRAAAIVPRINWNAFHKFPRRRLHFALKSLTRVGLVRF